MDLQAAGVSLLAAVTLFNLVAVVGLIRWTRAHGEHLQGKVANPTLLPAGTTVPRFRAESTNGTAVSNETFTDSAAVAVLGLGCPYCRLNLPQFVTFVDANGYPPDRVVAVIWGDGNGHTDDLEAMLAALEPVSTVVRETLESEPICRAFSVRAFPSFYLVDSNGTIAASTHAVRLLPEPTSGRRE